MIEPICTGSLAPAGALRPSATTAAAPPVAAVSPVKPGADLSALAAEIKALATSPPVDAARIAALRSAIAAGSYTPDPQAIADKMLTLDRGSSD